MLVTCKEARCWGLQLWVGVRKAVFRIKMGRAPEVIYEVESVKTQSRPPISQRLGVKKKTSARTNQTGRRFHRWLGGL